jgi:hypothetical protein
MAHCSSRCGHRSIRLQRAHRLLSMPRPGRARTCIRDVPRCATTSHGDGPTRKAEPADQANGGAVVWICIRAARLVGGAMAGIAPHVGHDMKRRDRAAQGVLPCGRRREIRLSDHARGDGRIDPRLDRRSALAATPRHRLRNEPGREREKPESADCDPRSCTAAPLRPTGARSAAPRRRSPVIASHAPPPQPVGRRVRTGRRRQQAPR